MISRLWAINAALVVLIFIVSWNVGEVWTSPLDFRTAFRHSNNERKPTGFLRTKKRAIPAESAFESIPTNNLFSPEREEYAPNEEKGEATEIITVPAKISGKKIDLYGIIMLDDLKKALINNPDSKAKDHPIIWVKEGDVLGQYKVNSISKDRLTLLEGNKRYDIMLYEKKKEKASPVSASSEIKSPNVIRAKPSDPQKQKNPEVKANDPEADFVMVKTPFGYIKQRKKTSQ